MQIKLLGEMRRLALYKHQGLPPKGCPQYGEILRSYIHTQLRYIAIADQVYTTWWKLKVIICKHATRILAYHKAVHSPKGVNYENMLSELQNNIHQAPVQLLYVHAFVR